MIGEFLRRLGYYLRRGQFEAELDEEMRHHMFLKERDSASLFTAQEQFAKLCTGFAILVLVIACVGLYDAVAYNVARRTGEIGIRDGVGRAARDPLALTNTGRGDCAGRRASRGLYTRKEGFRNRSDDRAAP